MAAHSSILAWRIPWTEEPGGLQSMGSQGVRHHWAQTQQKQSASVWFSLCLTFLGFLNSLGLFKYEHFSATISSSIFLPSIPFSTAPNGWIFSTGYWGSVEFFFRLFSLRVSLCTDLFIYLKVHCFFFNFAVSNVLLISSKKHTKYCIILLQKLHLVLFYSWIIIVIVSITSLSKFIITVLKFFTELVSFIGHWPLLILHSWMLDFVSAFKLYCTFFCQVVNLLAYKVDLFKTSFSALLRKV